MLESARKKDKRVVRRGGREVEQKMTRWNRKGKREKKKSILETVKRVERTEARRQKNN
jgi:hypothetical protein